MSVASLASGTSDHTGIIKRLPLSNLAPSTRDTPDFHATTSPRMESRLARRPQPQFPYSLQPFQLLPASPEERDMRSLEEANRRIQQARALSDRQQQFGQLLDLASAGKPPFCLGKARNATSQTAAKIYLNALCYNINKLHKALALYMPLDYQEILVCHSCCHCFRI